MQRMIHIDVWVEEDELPLIKAAQKIDAFLGQDGIKDWCIEREPGVSYEWDEFDGKWSDDPSYEEENKRIEEMCGE